MAENPYHDRIEGDVLTYTGAGRAGDQSVSGSNARILEQREKQFPIYGFQQIASRRDKKIGNRRWAFLGLLQFMRCYRERQMDSDGAWRNVWVFELRIHVQPGAVKIESERALTDDIFDRAQSDSPLDEEVVGVEERAAEASKFDLQILEPIRKRMLAFDPRQFEHFIKDLLSQSGFERVEVTKYSQDGGIDINARPGIRAWPLKHVLLQVQAKRWLHTVGRKEVAELRGSLLPHAVGCIVTTSHFSKAAHKESTEPGKSPITTIDGYELANIINTLKLKIE